MGEKITADKKIIDDKTSVLLKNQRKLPKTREKNTKYNI